MTLPLSTDPAGHARRLRPGRAALALFVVILVSAAAYKISEGFYFLVLHPNLPIDLNYYYSWVHAYFAGNNIYARPELPEYLPAAMPVLFPLAIWDNPQLVRWAWALLNLAALIALAWMAVRVSGTRERRAQALIVLLLLAITGTSVSIGNGQLTLLLLPLIVGAVLLGRRMPVKLWQDALIGGMFAVALVKPHLAGPFVWLVVIFPGGLRLRPLTLMILGYAGLTLLALPPQSTDGLTLIRQAIANAAGAAPFTQDGNVQALIGLTGRSLHMDARISEIAAGAASLLFWALLGGWVWKFRRAPLWLQLSVVALVARLWTYHRIYDDVLLIFPMVALLAIARDRGSTDRITRISTVLLVLTALFSLTATLPLSSYRQLLRVYRYAYGPVMFLDLLWLLWWSWAVFARPAEEKGKTGSGQDDTPPAARLLVQR